MDVLSAEINGVKMENVLVKNSNKVIEFKQNDGEEALIKGIKEILLLDNIYEGK